MNMNKYAYFSGNFESKMKWARENVNDLSSFSVKADTEIHKPHPGHCAVPQWTDLESAGIIMKM